MLSWTFTMDSVRRLHVAQPPVSDFFFFFFFAGCDATRCPRFASSSTCTGAGLICSLGNVVHLYRSRASTVWTLNVFPLRALQQSGLTGTISSSIGQLSALTALCVFIVWSFLDFSPRARCLFVVARSQGLANQQFGWNNALVNGQLDRTSTIVCFFVCFARNLTECCVIGV
jgi:hypothetical protein